MQRNKSFISPTRPTEPEERITLNRDEMYDLKIVKQAILKSAIEGGQIKKINILPNGKETVREETDEEFLERWIKFIYRNQEVDKKLTESPPF